MDLLKLNMLRTLVDDPERLGANHYDAVIAILSELALEDATIEGVFNVIAENYTNIYDWGD